MGIHATKKAMPTGKKIFNKKEEKFLRSFEGEAKVAIDLHIGRYKKYPRYIVFNDKTLEKYKKIIDKIERQIAGLTYYEYNGILLVSQSDVAV